MATNILYAPKKSEIGEQGVRMLHENQIDFHVVNWPPDDPERRENVYLVTTVGEFAGLDGLRFYVNEYKHLQTLAIRRVFRSLAERWLRETRYCSTIYESTKHPAFQRIVNLGEPIIPMILKHLQKHPDHWFWALTEITKENPANEVTAGNIEAICKAWIDWGRQRGFI